MTPTELTTTHPCRHCGRSAHPGMALERLAAALLNGGFAALTVILRAR